MDHSNHDTVNMPSQQITTVLNLLVQITNNSFRLLADQMTQIGDTMAIPRLQTQNGNLSQNSISLTRKPLPFVLSHE